jgi:hypothetical protein
VRGVARVAGAEATGDQGRDPAAEAARDSVDPLLSVALDDDDGDAFGDDVEPRNDTVADEQTVVMLSAGRQAVADARAWLRRPTVFSRCVAGREADRGRAWR